MSTEWWRMAKSVWVYYSHGCKRCSKCYKNVSYPSNDTNKSKYSKPTWHMLFDIHLLSSHVLTHHNKLPWDFMKHTKMIWALMTLFWVDTLGLSKTTYWLYETQLREMRCLLGTITDVHLLVGPFSTKLRQSRTVIWIWIFKFNQQNLLVTYRKSGV